MPMGVNEYIYICLHCIYVGAHVYECACVPTDVSEYMYICAHCV